MKTDITVLLDRSGSMESIREDTIGGFNAFMSEQKALAGEAVLSLIQFDGQGYDHVINAVPLAQSKPLTRETFVPRGNTSLLDAMFRAITDTGARLAAMADTERPENVVMVIITDGQENSSKDATRPQVLKAVEHQRDVYQWNFIYLGANQDAITEAASFGIPQAAAASYLPTPDSVKATYRAVSHLVASARSGQRPAISTSMRASLGSRLPK